MLQVLFAARIGPNLLYWLPWCMQKLMSIIAAESEPGWKLFIYGYG